MQGDDRAFIAEFLSRQIAKLTDTRPRSEKELKRGFPISPPERDNSVAVATRIISRHNTHRIEILFKVDNPVFRQIHRAFFRQRASPVKYHCPSMIYVNFEHAADRLCGEGMSPLIRDQETQASAFRYVEKNGPQVFEWVRALSNSTSALETYLRTTSIQAAWFPLTIYALTKNAHGKDAAVSYANTLDRSDLPELMADMATFLMAERP